MLASADVTDTAAKVARLEAENADLRSRLAAAENRDDLSPLRLVPVEVFGASCPDHCGPDPDCESAFGLMDAVQAWSDCNRAYGHLYRKDDTDPKYREPGDTVEVFVRAGDLPWFERRFGEYGGDPGARIAPDADMAEHVKEYPEFRRSFLAAMDGADHDVAALGGAVLARLDEEARAAGWRQGA